MGQDIAEFPHLKRWLDQLLERPAVKKGLAVSAEARSNLADDKEAQKILFGQRAR
jgi:GST-like protein